MLLMQTGNEKERFYPQETSYCGLILRLCDVDSILTQQGVTLNIALPA